MGDPPLVAWDAGEIVTRLEDTLEGWRPWPTIHQSYEGPWRDLVHHSGRVLQALTFAPTGAIVAAPTTSLPETVGCERNWDYRYTWVLERLPDHGGTLVGCLPRRGQRVLHFLAAAAASSYGGG